jgi:hypothetical protein
MVNAIATFKKKLFSNVKKIKLNKVMRLKNYILLLTILALPIALPMRVCQLLPVRICNSFRPCSHAAYLLPSGMNKGLRIAHLLLKQIFYTCAYPLPLAAHPLPSGATKGLRIAHLLVPSPLFLSLFFLPFTCMPRSLWPPGGSGFVRRESFASAPPISGIGR